MDNTIVAVLTGIFGGFLLSVILFELAVRSVKKGDARAKRKRSHREGGMATYTLIIRGLDMKEAAAIADRLMREGLAVKIEKEEET